MKHPLKALKSIYVAPDKQYGDEEKEIRSTTGSNKDPSNEESGGRDVKTGKSKKLLKKRERNNKRSKRRSLNRKGNSFRSSEAKEESAPVTSTPVETKCLKIMEKKRESKRGKFMKKRSI